MTLIRSRVPFAVGLALCVAVSACGGRAANNAAPTPDPVRSAFGPGPAGRTGTSPGSTPTATRTPPPRGNATRGSASLQEPGTDALKFGPAATYAEIQSAAIRGASRTVTFTLTFAVAVPAKTEDSSTTWKTGFRVKVGESPYVLTASLSSTGMTSSATKDGKRVRYTGTLTRKGATLTFVVPWTFFGGAQPFTWTGFSAWDHTTTAARYYSVDIIPNAGEAPFPQS